jgi:hypothetical protein
MSAPAADVVGGTDETVTSVVDAIDATVPAAAAAALAQPASTAAQHEAKKFLLKHKEKLKMNQYWYERAAAYVGRRRCSQWSELCRRDGGTHHTCCIRMVCRSPAFRYSLPTIAAMVTEAERESKRACFLSTPSIFFSLNDKTLQANSKVFDVSAAMWDEHGRL